MTAPTTGWYLARHGRARGPFSLVALRQQRPGRVRGDLVWHPSLDGWQPVTEVPSLHGTAGTSTRRRARWPVVASAVAVGLALTVAIGWQVWLRVPVVVSTQLLPSADEQVVVVDDHLTITIPGGLLEEPTSARVSVRRAGPVRDGSALVAGSGAYHLGFDGAVDGAVLDAPVRVEFTVPVDDELRVIAALDASTGGWVVVDTEVDRARGVIAHETSRLATWGWLTTRGATSVVADASQLEAVGGLPGSDQPCFEVFHAPQATARVGDRSGDVVAIDTLAAEVAVAVESAHRTYHRRGLDPGGCEPGMRFPVLLDPDLAPDGDDDRAAAGMLAVSTHYAGWTSVRGTAARAAFHAVQHRQLGEHASSALAEHRWLARATAQHAAWWIALQPPPDPAYQLDLRLPPGTVDGTNELAMAWFVTHLASVDEVGFRSLWAAIRAEGGALGAPLSPQALDRAVVGLTGVSAPSHHRDHLHRVLTERLADADVLADRAAIEVRGADGWERDGQTSSLDVQLRAPRATTMGAVVVLPPSGDGPRTYEVVTVRIDAEASVAVLVVPVDQAGRIQRTAQGAVPVVDRAGPVVGEGPAPDAATVTIAPGEAALVTVYGMSDGAGAEVVLRTGR